ncbi:MAG: helix-turn-helix transcriptional regulator [Clostridiales bacterium]|nr:helix-turn-helix transcriptional regulator [Clostridiales bacterium]
MPILRQFEFDRFCKSIDLKFIDNGLLFGNDWKHDDLSAPFARLYIVLDGKGIIIRPNKQIALDAGYAYIIPPNYSFGCYTPNHLKKIFSHFNINKTFSTGIFDGVDKVLKLKIDIAKYLEYYNALENKDSSYYYDIQGDFTKLIFRFVSHFKLDSFEDIYLSLSPKIKKLYRFIKDDITAKTRTNDLANYLNISQSMLSKIYKSETGHTLKWFLQQILIQRAQLLLLTTSKSIKEIAYELQYNDALYFSRVFKKWVGESPTVYRSKNKVV